MRGTLSILVTILICIVVFVLYYFLGKGQISKQISAVEEENRNELKRLQEIDRMAAELPVLMQQLPQWRDRLALYKQAIPEPIQDNQFLHMLAYQLEAQGVKLLTIEVVPEGKWLGEIGEQQEEELIAKGIDPDQARDVSTAFYSINLIGEFKNVLTAFENLKQYRRLYTIDEVVGPAGSAPGAITQIVDPNITPIQITGRIYYGIKDSYLTNEDLLKVFESSVIKPRAKRIQSGIVAGGQSLLELPGASSPAMETDSDSSPPDDNTGNGDSSEADGESGTESIAHNPKAHATGKHSAALAREEG